MDFQFTKDNLIDLLSSPISRFEKDRKLCSKCDYYDSVGHSGLKCNHCGGEMVSVKNWTIINLLNRVKPAPTTGENWLSKFIADYLAATTGIDWSLCYSWACKNSSANKEMLREYKKQNS